MTVSTRGLLVALAIACGGCRSVGQHAPSLAGGGPASVAGTLDGAPERPPAGGEATTGKPYKNTITWSTASELDNFGFDIYRSESADGPFVCLNREPVEGAGTIDEPRTYEWVDDTIDPRLTYYYYVESISMAGVRQRFTPVGMAAPKIPPAAGQPPVPRG